MNASFVFPTQQAVTPRPQRPQKQGAPSSRDSNSLRASVLDVALELGISSNSLVADWMFNNAVREEDECEEPLSPEYSGSLASPDSQSSKTQFNGSTSTIINTTHPFPGTAAGDIIDADVRMASNTGRGIPVAFPDGAPLPPNIPLVPVMPAPSIHSTATGSTKKLKKPRKGDGYESDSGYLSEGGRKSKEKEKKKKTKAKEENSDAKGGNVAGLMVDPDQRTRKRSFVDAVRGRKTKDIDAGYATDASSSKTQKSKKDKSKAKHSKHKDASDVHYETDGGTKKSKTKSFFGLSSRSSKPDLTKDRATTPPVPLLKEQMPLPIAQRFATTLASPSNGSTPSLDEARSTISYDTSVPTTSLDGSRSTTSLGVSLSSAVSSKSTVNDVLLSNVGKLPSLSFQPLNVDCTRPPTPQSAPHLSPPVSFPSSAQLPGTIRDSQASSGSSSSSVSNLGSRTTTSEVSTITSNVSSPFTSPATSYSHFQTSSPRTGHGTGAGSTSTTTSNTQGYGYSQTQRMDTFGKPSASSRSTLPPSSAAAASAAAGMMSFQITRDVTTVPLVMRQLRQGQQEHEPLAQIQDDGQAPTQIPQIVETEQVEVYPKRMSVVLPTPPLNISKGGGLRVRPSLEKINLLGLRKDNREQLSAGGTTPSPISTTAGSPPLKVSHSPNSQTPAGQLGIPHSPMHLSPLQSGRSWNGTPMSPPQNPTPGNLSLSPHAFTSAPNSVVSSPVHPNTIIPARSAPRSRLSLNPPPNGNQLAAPTALAYYDIPPPSPPPMGPLPLPPPLPGDGPRISRTSSPIPPRNRSRSPIPPLPTNHNHPLDGPSAQFPSPAQLRQRMLDRTPRKLPSDETHGPPIINTKIRRGKESPFPPAPIFHRTPVADGGSSSGASDESAESHEGAVYQVEPLPRSPILPVSLNSQEKRVLDSVLSRKQEKRSSWIDFGDVLSNKDNDTSEEDVGSRNDEHDVGEDSLDGHGSLSDASVHDRLVGSANRSEESAYSDKVLTRRRRLSEDLKPAQSPDIPQSKYAWDDSLTVGDRTSRWSGSIYSRMSILDEEESNAARDRFVKRVEAMLADGGRKPVVDETERNRGGVGAGVARQNSRRDQFVPPVPKIPVAFTGSTRRSEAVPAGRVWNKF